MAIIEGIISGALKTLTGLAGKSAANYIWTISTTSVLKKFRTKSDKYNDLNAKELLEFYSDENHISLIVNGKLHIIPACYAITPTGDGSILEQKIMMKIDKEELKLSNIIDSYTKPVIQEIRKNSDLFDGKVVRLSSIEKQDGVLVVTVQQASYFYSVSTNFSMGHVPKNRNQSLRQLVHGENKKLPSFKGNPLVNIIGVVHMVESSDGIMIVQKRGQKVANRINTLSSSVSGTFEWVDVLSGEDSLVYSVFQCAIRETLDELGFITQGDAFFLGAIRDYERGGMPDFYYYSKSDRSFSQIQDSQKDANESWESDATTGFEFFSDRVDSKEQSRTLFQQRVDNFLSNNDCNANLTLYAGLLLATKNILDRAASLTRT
jgi:hypothetical protein